MKLGQRIKAYLLKNNIKQKLISDTLGVSEVVASSLLSGSRGISAEEYFSICDALQVPYDLFATDDKVS